MKKLYYDCAIKAAYMAKYFGVKFNFYDRFEFTFQFAEDYKFDVNRKYYVAPESEHIFEVKKDDYFISNDPYDGKGSIFQSDGSDHDKKVCEIIIMRDNKHFFASLIEEK